MREIILGFLMTLAALNIGAWQHSYAAGIAVWSFCMFLAVLADWQRRQ